MRDGMNLKVKSVRRTVLVSLFVGALLFISAGTLHFWQGWAYLIAFTTISASTTIYFYWHDRETLARRMFTREKIGAQRFIMLLLRLLYFYALILAGWDFRAGWTRTQFGPVPWWLSLLAVAVIIGSNFWFVAVLKANRFAASIIHIESGQTIAATGPYRFIRHPMYSGIIVNWLVTPLVLGSVVTLPLFALIVPLLIARLLNEEKLLRRELPGYAEYCRQNRYRLIPLAW